MCLSPIKDFPSVKQKSTRTSRRLQEDASLQDNSIKKRKLQILLKCLFHSCKDGHETVEHHRQQIDRILPVLMTGNGGQENHGGVTVTLFCWDCEKKIDELSRLDKKREDLDKSILFQLNSMKYVINAGFTFEEEEDTKGKLKEAMQARVNHDNPGDPATFSSLTEATLDALFELRRTVVETTREVETGPCVPFQT